MAAAAAAVGGRTVSLTPNPGPSPAPGTDHELGLQLAPQVTGDQIKAQYTVSTLYSTESDAVTVMIIRSSDAQLARDGHVHSHR